MAITITWSDVTAIAPELSAAPSGMQNAILAALAKQMDPNVWEDNLNLGATFLAAHMATMLLRKGVTGAVASESVGSVSRTYVQAAAAKSGIESTSYGQEYDRLLKALALARFGVA